MTIANNFVTDKNSGEVMTVGWVQNLVKTIELCVQEKNIHHLQPIAVIHLCF